MVKYSVRLTEEERTALTEVIGNGKAAARKIKHANVLLKPDAGGPNWGDAQSADAFDCSARTGVLIGASTTSTPCAARPKPGRIAAMPPGPWSIGSSPPTMHAPSSNACIRKLRRNGVLGARRRAFVGSLSPAARSLAIEHPRDLFEQGVAFQSFGLGHGALDIAHYPSPRGSERRLGLVRLVGARARCTERDAASAPGRGGVGSLVGFFVAGSGPGCPAGTPGYRAPSGPILPRCDN